MRKVTTIFITIIFLMAFVGIQINKHYSHGKLYSIAVFQDARHCYDNTKSCDINSTNFRGAMFDQNNCSCEDKTEVLIINSEFLIEKSGKLKVNVIDLFFVEFLHYTNTAIESIQIAALCLELQPSQIKQDFQAEFGVFLC